MYDEMSQSIYIEALISFFNNIRVPFWKHVLKYSLNLFSYLLISTIPHIFIDSSTLRYKKFPIFPTAYHFIQVEHYISRRFRITFLIFFFYHYFLNSILK